MVSDKKDWDGLVPLLLELDQFVSRLSSLVLGE